MHPFSDRRDRLAFWIYLLINDFNLDSYAKS